jgi:serine/threonine-protein kinase
VELASGAASIAVVGELTASENDTTWRKGPAAAEQPTIELGPFILGRRLGGGGQGEVFEAKQTSLNRTVALKMLPSWLQSNAAALARFRTEGEAVARLNHPNVLQVYDCSEHQGRTFLVMEHAEGGTLADKLSGGPLDPTDAAHLLAKLARAAHAAHLAGVVHRDLKPSNVLFLADGTPKLADFGLARLLDAEGERQTVTEQIMGTANYMAPEQAEGAARDAGPAADIWSLGVVLYECLTGRAPFRASGRRQVLHRVLTADPEPPSRLCRRLSPELEAVCLRCLQKGPARRYSSALELAEDLERWLRKEPTHERPKGWVTRSLDALKRHQRLIATVVLAGVILVLLVALGGQGDTDQAVTEIEERIAAGAGPVILVPSVGGPVWSKVIVGKAKAAVYTEPDGRFAFSSTGESLLQLVRDVRRTHYRFRARVRHWQGQPAGQVGVYFLHRVGRTSQATAHWFYDVAFNDITSEIERYEKITLPRVPAGVPPPPPPAGNRIFLDPTVIADGITLPGISRRTENRCSQVFTPPEKGQPTVYRQIVVEVAPEKIVIEWDGKRAEVTAKELADDARTIESFLDEAKLRDPPPNALPIVFGPRSSLGLYVQGATAFYCDVAVEPRPAP